MFEPQARPAAEGQLLAAPYFCFAFVAFVACLNCRRDQLLEDSFLQLNAMGPERLKGRLRIAYVNEAGLAEAGIDGGGLFKDFMEELLRQGFSPQVGAVLHVSLCVTLPQYLCDSSN
jgi:hypothetical protein